MAEAKEASLEQIDTIISPYLEWAHEVLWGQGALLQVLIIIFAFLVSGFFYTFTRNKIKDAIEKAELPVNVKRVALNLRKLLIPFFTLIILFILSQIAASPIGGSVTVLAVNTGVMKVLLAWIFIRVAVQFIENNLIRNIFATTIWVILALSIFGVLEQTTQSLDSVGFSLGEFRLTALAVIKGLISIFVLLYFATFISGFAENRVFKVKSLTRSSQVLIAKIIRVSLIVFAILIAVTSAGIDLSLFAVFGGAVGLGVGFGLQKGVSNLFSGMLLLLDRSIKPGDVIEIPDIGTFGWVNNMAARYTEIVTRDNKSFLIPNEDFITQRVVNWSHGNSLIRIHLAFGVHYDSDPHQVTEVAIKAVKDLQRVVDSPEPVCWITEFGDSSINFDLRFWIKDAEKGVANVRGQAFLALWDAFKENNIQIPYPHREVYLHDAD